MTQWHMKSKRKASGGILNTHRRSDKRLAWKGGDPTHTTIPQDKKARVDIADSTGGNVKQKLKKAFLAQISEAGSGKVQQYEVLDVEKNDANRQYARRNIITKGSIIRVKNAQGEAFANVTSRPGQGGMVNAVLVEGDFGTKSKKKAPKKVKSEEKTEKEPEEKSKD